MKQTIESARVGVRAAAAAAAALIVTFATGVFLLVSCNGGGGEPAAGGAQDINNNDGGGGGAGAQAASAPAPIDPATAGSIAGVVKFAGDAPPREAIGLSAECKQSGHAQPQKEDVIVNAGGTLRNVFVYIKSGLEGRKFPAPPAPAVLDQIGCVYTPHVLAVQAGQQLIIKNSDPTTHNVNCVGGKNPGFNRAMTPGGGDIKVTFKSQEIRKFIKCDYHPWMGAYCHVVAHPFFAVTGDSGEFTLSGLPPGAYTVEAVHEVFGAKTEKVVVGPKETKRVEFTYATK